MKLNPIIIAGAGLFWLGSLTAAYYGGMGKNQLASVSGGSPASRSSAGTSATSTAGSGSGKAANGTLIPEAARKVLTVKQIIAKAKNSMQGGAMQNPRAMMKAMALIEEIAPEDIMEALAELEKGTDPQQKMIFQMALLGRWAEVDGAVAMKYAEEHPSGAGMMAQMGKMGVASAWAEKDPEAVWKWYQGQAEADGGAMFGGNMVLASLFASMAVKDPDLAFKRLEEIDGPGKMMALAGLMQVGLFDDDKRQMVLKKIDSIPDEAERKQAKQMMLSQLAMASPDQAIAWMKTQPAAEQSELRVSIGTMLMMSDPKQGASILLEGATDGEKPQRYATVIGSWAHFDTNAAGTWLREQPQGPHLDNARESFVRTASQKDPESAMAWAGTITDSSTRVTSTITAYQAWKKKDAAAADRALEASGLSADHREVVRTADSTAPKTPTPTPAPAPAPSFTKSSPEN